MFSGGFYRLEELFPSILQEKSLRVTGKFEFGKKSCIIDLNAIEGCLPSSSEYKNAVRQTHSGRRFLLRQKQA
jgi:hypothetical protein